MKYALFTGVLIFAQPVIAWGPFAHAYIAAKVIPDAPPQVLFGAMSADMNAICGRTDINAAYKHLTHHKADLLCASSFRMGLQTHNSDWGADSYAHAYFSNPDEKPYPYTIFKQLSEEMEISINDAEDIMEAIVDYVICRDLGPEFLAEILEAVNAVGSSEEQMLVDAFTVPLCTEISNLPHARAERTIRSMFRLDRFLIRFLVSFMSLPDRLRQNVGIPLTAASFDMDTTKMERCIQRGVELCADCRIHLDAIADEIAIKLVEAPNNLRNP